MRVLDRAHESLFRPTTLRNFVSGAQAVVHLAGRNRGSNADLFSDNVASTVGLLDAIAAYGKDRPLFLYASSLQVYLPSTSVSLIDEGAKVDDSQPFSASKLLAESSLKRWAESDTIRAVSMRLSNVYGKGCRPYYNSVVATFLDRARKGKSLVVSGGGQQTRDFIHITDVSRAILSLMKLESRGYEVFNVSTGRGTSILDLARLVKKAFPHAKIEAEPSPDELGYHLVGDPSKLERVTGFRPALSLEEGLELTLAGPW